MDTANPADLGDPEEVPALVAGQLLGRRERFTRRGQASGHELAQELHPTHQMTVSEIAIDHVASSGGTQASGLLRVAKQAVQRTGQADEVGWIGEEQAVVSIDDLIVDATDRSCHDRPGLPHGFGHREAEPFGEALLDDDAGVSLERVDDDCVLVDVVHRD